MLNENDTYPPGTRVYTRFPVGPDGQKPKFGVVLDVPDEEKTNGYHYVVLLDGWDRPLGFYKHEVGTERYWNQHYGWRGVGQTEQATLPPDAA